MGLDLTSSKPQVMIHPLMVHKINSIVHEQVFFFFFFDERIENRMHHTQQG